MPNGSGHADARQFSDLADGHALRLVVYDHGQLFNLAQVASTGHRGPRPLEIWGEATVSRRLTAHRHGQAMYQEVRSSKESETYCAQRSQGMSKEVRPLESPQRSTICPDFSPDGAKMFLWMAR